MQALPWYRDGLASSWAYACVVLLWVCVKGQDQCAGVSVIASSILEGEGVQDGPTDASSCCEFEHSKQWGQEVVVVSALDSREKQRCVRPKQSEA
jgi:hypothetical protein